MMNSVSLVGRLTRDPELKYTPSGVAVATFTLAINRPFSNQQGDREADFVQCVVWKKPAENAANYLGKGSLIAVNGRIQTRSYDNNEGRRVYVTEVVAERISYLESKGSRSETQSPTTNSNQSSNNTSRGHSDDPFANDSGTINISDDDLPF
ncbi:single-stranded DNA-binding protein [Alkalicoccobacillus gibsonii]|uniref:single-stranded DNA-binding protein n=1 Tax=Alkalicoccobacillus gibsonii TaxID=79881 RepID=UPI001933B646|nr:single-stranded DNA-binding protein [Alkalicoccobacillus gibsonii]MBM0064960.1 single-stranded DNA-binding protein [Alkalicoccobacillus gibsonii]